MRGHVIVCVCVCAISNAVVREAPSDEIMFWKTPCERSEGESPDD